MRRKSLCTGGLRDRGGEAAKGEWGAWLESVGNCNLCPTLKRHVSRKNFLGKTLTETEVGRGFPLLSVMRYGHFQLSFPKKHCSVDTTISLFLPYMFPTQAFYLA